MKSGQSSKDRWTDGQTAKPKMNCVPRKERRHKNSSGDRGHFQFIPFIFALTTAVVFMSWQTEENKRNGGTCPTTVEPDNFLSDLNRALNSKRYMYYMMWYKVGQAKSSFLYYHEGTLRQFPTLYLMQKFA